MLAIMLDPRYKGLQCISKFVRPAQAKAVVADYDKHILLPLLQQAWAVLNPVPEHSKEVSNDEDVPEVDEFFLFGTATSPEEATEGAIVKELSLFRRLVIDKEDLQEGPLTWWKHNEAKFPNVGFLARQYLGIPGSQIEIERIFSVAGVLMNLLRTKLGIDNLESLVMIYTNWPNDSRVGCTLYEHLANWYSKEDKVLDEEAEVILK